MLIICKVFTNVFGSSKVWAIHCICDLLLICVSVCVCVASSPGSSQLFDIAREKCNIEKLGIGPGDEAMCVCVYNVHAYMWGVWVHAFVND